MPRILDGWWAAGVGGGIASVGKVGTIAPAYQVGNAGGTCWLKSGLALYQQGSHLETYDVVNDVVDKAVDPQGCYQLAAGGGVYAAQFNDGVRVSNNPGHRLPGYGVGDVGPDGIAGLLAPNGLYDGRLLKDIQLHGNGTYEATDASYRPACETTHTPGVALPGRVYGWHMHGDLVVYQAEQGGRLILQYRDRLVGVELARGLVKCFRPDFEEYEDGRIAILYATEEGEAPWQLVPLWTSRAALTQPLTADPAPPVVVPPVDPPTPPAPPAPPIGVSMTLSPLVTLTIAAFAAKFPVPQMPAGATASDDAFENLCRIWSFNLAQQVRFDTADPRWGVKNAGGGRPQSKDSISFNDVRLWNFDLLSGVGTGHPTLVKDPQGADITGQTFMAVSPVDRLGTGGQVPPVEQPPVQPPPVAGVSREEVQRLIAAAVEAMGAAASQMIDDALARATADGRTVTRDSLNAAVGQAIDLVVPQLWIKTRSRTMWGHQHDVETQVERRKP